MEIQINTNSIFSHDKHAERTKLKRLSHSLVFKILEDLVPKLLCQLEITLTQIVSKNSQ